MPDHIVFATSSGSAAAPDGGIVAFREGEPWAADDPFVTAHKDLFSDAPPGPSFPRRTAPAVEQATAAPGERRNVRRA